MKKQMTILLLLSVMLVSSGCANGPFRQFFRGGACNTCNPPAGLFNRRQHTVDNCSNGVCGGVTPVDGAMIGGPTFGSGSLNPSQYPTEQYDQYPYPGTGSGFGGSVTPSTAPPLPGARMPGQ